MTKNQLIALLEAMENNSRECAKSYEEFGKHDRSERLDGEASAYLTVITMLKNPNFAKELAGIYELAI